MITPYLYVPFVAWVLAQLIKFVIEIIKGDADWRYLYASGGMPSAHSAVVVSLATYALINAGPSSPIFGITAILAAIVMYDSFGVRRSAGEQAKTLNKLITELAREGNLRKPSDYNQLREILGHQPMEVLAGAILGVFTAVIFSWQKLDDIWLAAQAPLQNWQIMVVYGVGVALIISPVVVYLLAKKAIKRSKTYKSYFKALIAGNVLAGFVVLCYGFVAQQQIIPYGAMWIGAVLGLVWLVFIVILVGLLLSQRKQVKFESAVKDERKEDWLKKAGKKKK